jgi:serine/threonine protein kinase
MIGRTFLARYEVTRLLGEGGMGRVYLARQLDLNRTVVIKVMNESVAADPKFRSRFERETLLMAKFQHPYVVTLYDASLSDPLGPCIVMEYVRGVNLEHLLAKDKRFAPARVGRVLGQLCEALQAAHDQGIIHRDLKPSNIMVVDAETPKERIKVMDFGLAKMIDPDEPEAQLKKITDTNVDFAVGTPGYICPEQVRGDPVDHRGDLYSVGVLAYELLTGRLPFNGASGMDMVLAHATEPPPSFADIGLDGVVPYEVEEVVMTCLAKDPADRPQSAGELAERFDLALLRADQERVDSTQPDFHIPDPSPPPPTKPFQDGATAPADDPTAFEFHLDAWMPQKIALLKLRGYVEANNGEVLESVPGRICVRLAPPDADTRPSGPLGWLGLGRKSAQMFLDLKMTSHPQRDNLLQIAARYRPADRRQAGDPDWRRTCVRQFIDLRGYLIGATEADA